ncbi:MAG: hypothetical protein AAB511_01640 [Patescibacteria group bacterium]
MKNSQRRYVSVLLALLAIALVVGGVYFYSQGSKTLNSDGKPVVTQKSVTILPYGNVTLGIGETATFAHNSLKVLRVVDDSRCATGATCIWAGTLHAEVVSVTGMGTSTETVELGKFLTTEAEKITLISADPYPKAGTIIAPEDYRLKFEVVERKVVIPDPKPTSVACYRGGCSSQVCSDDPGVISTCEYRAEYACYKTAKCERQITGKCGWTDTKDLQMCLKNPPAL